MTRLVVSVRSGLEAAAALAGGADVIDIKEPARGALGPADPAVWRDVCRRVGAARPVSAALGELLRDEPGGRLPQLEPFRFIKIGLAGCGHVADWSRRWRMIVERLPGSVAAVAVVYADYARAAAPQPEAVLACAAEADCKMLLVDTFHKTSGNLFAHLPPLRLRRLMREARAAALHVVLAGSLDKRSCAHALALAPDLVAVRRAVCCGGRSGTVDAARVRELVETIAGYEAREA